MEQAEEPRFFAGGAKQFQIKLTASVRWAPVNEGRPAVFHLKDPSRCFRALSSTEARHAGSPQSRHQGTAHGPAGPSLHPSWVAPVPGAATVTPSAGRPLGKALSGFLPFARGQVQSSRATIQTR